MRQPLKIGVDGRLLQGNLTGVGKYVLNLINYIIDRDGNFSAVVVTNNHLSPQVSNKKIKVVLDKIIFAKVKPMVWSRFLSARLLNKEEVDIYLSGDGFLPFFLKTSKIISVVHDINHILVPETMSNLRLLTTKLFFKTDISKASFIISNSFGTAKKLETYYKKSSDLVIYPIIDDWYKVLNKDEVTNRLKELNVTFPYILTVATEEPRKNLIKTIQAFISLKKRNKISAHKLLLVGSKGWKSESLLSLISNNPDIIRMGYISDEMMPYLYNGADIFVFPSKYEGFGIPPREALLCGTNVIVSDIPELREATFNAGTYIDPENETAYEHAILETLSRSTGKAFNTIDFTQEDQIKDLLPFLKAKFL